MKKMFFILSTFIFVGVGIYYYNLYLTQTHIKQDVQEIYKGINTTKQNIDLKQLETLPQPVKEYFTNVLSSNVKKIETATIKYKGSFTPSLQDEPMMIDGIGYYSMTKPAFIWQGRIKMMNIMETFKNNLGSTNIEFLDVYSVVDRVGEYNNKAQFLRWIVESVYYPTNLLPSNYITWESIDENSAKLITNYNNGSHTILVEFKDGFISKMSTNRFYGNGAYKQWIVTMDDYKPFDKVSIPRNVKMYWKLEEGLHEYLNMYVTKVDYNKLP